MYDNGPSCNGCRKPHQDSITESLLSKYTAKKLNMLAPGQNTDYFVPIEIHAADHELRNEDYFIISCDGHLFSTDGNTIEHDCLLTKKVNHKQMDIVFGHPLKLIPLPAGAAIIPTH